MSVVHPHVPACVGIVGVFSQSLGSGVGRKGTDVKCPSSCPAHSTLGSDFHTGALARLPAQGSSPQGAPFPFFVALPGISMTLPEAWIPRIDASSTVTKW